VSEPNSECTSCLGQNRRVHLLFRTEQKSEPFVLDRTEECAIVLFRTEQKIKKLRRQHMEVLGACNSWV
jgi:hypothetical protein